MGLKYSTYAYCWLMLRINVETSCRGLMRVIHAEGSCWGLVLKVDVEDSF